MKLVWSPEMASKAYLETVKYLKVCRESGVPELVSAMAAGWNAQLIVETWMKGGVTTTSIGLAVASRYTCGRHVCIVPDEQSKLAYIEAISKVDDTVTEVIVGEPEEVMNGLVGIDFMMVDCRRKDFEMVLRIAKLSNRGAVLICKNASLRIATGFRWRSIVDGGSRRVVRAVLLPVGKGLDIAYVSAPGGKSKGSSKRDSRWIKHIDQHSGEEIVIRK